MDLGSLTLDKLMRRVAKVEKAMEDYGEMERLLDDAAEDTPIVRELLQALGHLYRGKDERAVLIARQHLVIFLALRELERAGSSKRPRAQGCTDDAASATPLPIA